MYFNRLSVVINLIFLKIVASASESEIGSTGAGKGVLDFFLGNGPKFCNYCRCGKANQVGHSGKLLAGQFVESHEYPWLVLIHIQQVASSTATLLNERYVITSASQVYGLTPYDVKINVGEYNRCYPDVTGANHSVSAIFIHPEYDALTRSNDLALLRLSEPLPSDRRIRSICLPEPDFSYKDRVIGVVGWSDATYSVGLGQDSTSACRPKKISLPVLSREQCTKRAPTMSGTISVISFKDKSCAGVVGAIPTVCATDAGGPVQYQATDGLYELVGVLTDSNTCNDGSPPTTFTKVNDHLSWIFQNTRDSCFCSK